MIAGTTTSLRARLSRRLKQVLVAAALVTMGTVTSAAPSRAADANYAAFVVDAKTGKVLFSRNADARRYPASLTKMMTLYLLFEDLESGKIRLDTRFTVSAKAAGQAPSKLGVKAGSTITAKDAILALVTRSANDVAMVIAENLAGSEDAFANRMTRTARAIGMSRTTFRNPHGLPNSGQVTTARDMATLGRALQDRFPRYFSYFSTRVFTWKGVRIGNHNNLLGRVEGVDGIKTGYTRASGYNLVTSVHRDNRALVAVVMGGNTSRSRDSHMAELIRTYLPKASRGRRTAPLLVANNAQDDMPAPRRRPADIADVLALAEIDNTVSPTVLVEEPAQGDANEDAGANPVAVPTPAVEPEGWKIQLGAFPTLEGASQTLSRAAAAKPQLLAAVSAYTEPVAKGGGTLYRARFGGFASKQAARAACAQLERKDFACLALQ